MAAPVLCSTSIRSWTMQEQLKLEDRSEYTRVDRGEREEGRGERGDENQYLTKE